jgi:hypothetical protein
LNWNVLLPLAEEHGVQTMLVRRLEAGGFAGVPVAVREALQTRVRAQQLFALSLTAELFRVLDDFSKAHIDVLPVKGPVLSQVAHGDPALRSFGDLDFLLRHRDIAAAIERIQAMGFRGAVPFEAVRAGKIPGEYVFRKAGQAGHLELHTEKTFRHYPLPMRLDEMLERRRRIIMDGQEVPALALEDELVFQCVHGGKDFWGRLMWVCDVAMLLTRYPELDWEKARGRAREVGAERMLFTGVRLASDILLLQLPQEIEASIERDRDSSVLSAKIQNWIPYAGYRIPGTVARASYRIKLAGGGPRGVGYLLRLALSPTEEDWETKGAGKSRIREALRRPLRLMRKYGAGE